VPAAIRPYQPADRAACRNLWAQLVQHHRDLYDDQSIGGPEPGLEFDEHLARSDLAVLWVAESAGEVVGLCGLLVTGDEGQVEPVVVRPSHRGQGTGRALLETAIAEAWRRDLRFLGLQPVARNTRAIALFVSLGFDHLGHVDLFQDLKPELGRTWKQGITLHDHAVEY
jgi:GNAT superfamily N-acetyltransferase